MNSGTPNAAGKLATFLVSLAGAGIGPIWGWILQKILKALLSKGSQQTLVYMDKGQMIFVVNSEQKDFVSADDHAWEIVDQGKILNKEEADAINKPVIEALIKFGAFNKLRR